LAPRNIARANAARFVCGAVAQTPGTSWTGVNRQAVPAPPVAFCQPRARETIDQTGATAIGSVYE
jgi:hypothetical protein